MSENIKQIYDANPILANSGTDLMYFGQSPYTTGDDAAMLFSSFAAQFSTAFPWNLVVASQTMILNQGYITNSASLVVLALPASPSLGDKVAVIARGSGGWKITAANGQEIRIGNVVSLNDGSGYIQSNAVGDSIVLVYCQSSIGVQHWECLGAPQGNIFIEASVAGNTNALNNDLSSCINLSLTTGVTGILPVPNGGTGIATTTAYAPICGGTTATGVFQAASTGLGTSGFILTSNGASALPSFQTPAASSISITGTSGGAQTGAAFTFSGGTTGLTLAGSTNTFTFGGMLALANGGTNASLTASNGGIFYSTASAGAILAGTATANQVLLSGSSTTPAWSTATYPATTTANQLLYSSSANTIAGLSTANGGVLVTSNSGVPSILAGSGTTGTILQATASGTPAWSTATYPGTAGTSGTLLQSNGTNIVNTTATYPGTAGTSGTILISNGTNIVNSTATYPATTTVNQILYSSATNTVAGLTTQLSAVLATDSSGVPSLTNSPSTTNLTLSGSCTINGGGGNQTTLSNNSLTLNSGSATIDLYGTAGGSDKIRIIDSSGTLNIQNNSNSVICTFAQNGNVAVTGTLSKGGGVFKIDHPLDPKNKYLYHSFVESPDMLNIYSGIAILDENGQANVNLPSYFSALNDSFTYQLTCVNGFSNVYISKEIYNNEFSIAGGIPDLKVSWMITGIRIDKFANANRIIPEVDKEPENIGTYLHPEAWE